MPHIDSQHHHWLLTGRVFHGRRVVRKHQFHYRHWCVDLDLRNYLGDYLGDDLRSSSSTLPMTLSLMRPWSWLFHVAPRDYGAGYEARRTSTNKKINTMQQLATAMTARISNHVSNHADTTLPHRWRLISQGRVLFYVFNPISFWLGLDQNDILRAIVVEVHNTYGEQHYYLLAKKNMAAMNNGDVFTAPKEFHVSPFFDRDGYYRFRISHGAQFSATVDLLSPDHRLRISTSMTMTRRPFTRRQLLRIFFSLPLQPLKVIATIHLHALLLFVKKIGFRRKPRPRQNLTIANHVSK